MSDNISLDGEEGPERLTLLNNNERNKLENLPNSNEERRLKTVVSVENNRTSAANLNRSDTVSVSDAGSR